MPSSTWLDYLAKFRADNPHIRGRAVMSAASASYHNQGLGALSTVGSGTNTGNISNGTSTNHLTEFLTETVLGNVVEKYCAKGKIAEQAKNLKDAINKLPSDQENLENIQSILCDYIDFGIFSSQKGGTLLLNLIAQNEYELIKKLIKAYRADGGSKFAKDLKYDEETEDL